MTSRSVLPTLCLGLWVAASAATAQAPPLTTRPAGWQAPQGQADGIAIGPHGALAWTSWMQDVLRYRENDAAPIRILAKDLPGINSLAFDQKTGKLYASQVFLSDAIWEIDVAGNNPPRRIAKDMGGFNGFEVGPDGMLYGPLRFTGQVVRMNPADRAIQVINSEFQVPAALKLDR